jgi:REP element-mobilizing transposase RayT
MTYPPRSGGVIASTTRKGVPIMAGTYTKLVYHLVFSTKQRIPLIGDRVRDELHRYLGAIVNGEGGTLLAVGGMPDHIHLLARLTPTKTISEMLRRVKGNSSRWLNDGRMGLRKFGWQDGYAAFSVSQSQIARVRQYIETQPEHHRATDYRKELLTLLRRHGVEFDERHLWD